MKERRGRRKANKAVEAQPLIAALQERAEVVRQQELSEALGKLCRLTPEQLQELDVLTRRLVDRLLSRPVNRLQQRGGDLDTLRDLFGIDEDRGG